MPLIVELSAGDLPTGALRELPRRTVPTVKEWSEIWRDPTTVVESPLPDGHGGLAGVMPDRRLRDHLHHASSTVIPVHRHLGPARVGTFEKFGECGQTLALESWTPHLSGLSRWSGFVECGVQTQSGDKCDRASHGLTEMEQVKGSVAAVGDHYHRTVGYPATDLSNDLTRPVGESFVSSSHLMTVSFRRSQCGQRRQRPCPMCLWYVGQQHQAYPAQTGGLDEMTPAGAHRIAIYPLRPDPNASPSLQRLVNAEYQWTITPIQGVESTATAEHGSTGEVTTELD